MSDLFNKKAKDWDTNDRVNNLSAAIGTSILNTISFQPQMEVMDFGAGTGLISSFIAPFVNKIVAVDISESMLNALIAKTELSGKVEVICQDIVEQPLDRQFDVIMSAMALHHVKDINKLIQIFSYNLKSGATVVLADLDKEDGSFHPEGTEGVFHFGFERGKLELMLESNGFNNIQFQTVHTIDGEVKQFPVFLVVATKH